MSYAKRLLIIGAGGVGNVVARKAARETTAFSDILLASRTHGKCDDIAQAVGGDRIHTAQVNADESAEVSSLIRDFGAEIVINVALPYQDLAIMDACLETGAHYLDTANYEPPEEAHFEYSWQWAYRAAFEQAGIMALLGCGFDPGVTGVFTAYARKHHNDEIHCLDIVDCNAGDHGRAFATNFNPEINIREITQPGRYWENGQWVEIPAMSLHQAVEYPEIGERESYVLFHEELESLVGNFPEIRRARFWMTFSQNYLHYLRVLQDVGMTSIEPIDFEGHAIQPLQFLKAVLPSPSSLGEGYSGQTSIGCQLRGLKDGSEQTYYIYNNCRHQDAFEDTEAQGVSYTTGVPAVIGAMLMAQGEWMRPGVWNVEELDPDPFMALLPHKGLPWHERHGCELAFPGAD